MERKNLNKKEVKEVIKRFNFQPARHNVITTINIQESKNNVVVSEEAVSVDQYVIAAGPTSLYEAGDLIRLDLDAMVVKQRSDLDSTIIEEKIKFKPFFWEDHLFSIMPDSRIEGKYI